MSPGNWPARTRSGAIPWPGCSSGRGEGWCIRPARRSVPGQQLVPWQSYVGAGPPRYVVAWPEPWPRPAAVLSPAGALASPVTGRCPAQPPRCGIVVVLTTTK